MTDGIATIGSRLKAERERRGMSSQKAADELRLDTWAVEALEAEDYDRVGPSVYAKGHLKRYAALLGLPWDEIVGAYESRAQGAKAPAAHPVAAKQRTEQAEASDLPLPQIVGAVAAALLAVGLLWWKPWQHRGAEPAARGPLAANPGAASADHASGPALAAGPPVAPPAASPPTALAAPPSASEPPSKAAQVAAAAVPSAGVGRARLRLSFSADSSVDVHDAAGRRVFAGNGRANSVRTIAGIAPMRVYLGFASGVQLEINNRAVAIGPQFVVGDVARFEAGADGVLRHDSRSAAAPGATAPGATASGAAASGAALPGAVAPGVPLHNSRPTG